MTKLPTDERAQPGPDANQHHGRRTAGLMLAIAVVLVAAVALVVVSRRHDESSDSRAVTPTELVGHRVPDASYQGFDGTAATLAGLHGRPLVLNFWSATCIPCRTEMPALQRIHHQEGDQVTFLGIDTGDGVTVGRDAARQTGVDYALASDPQSRVAARLGVVALPTTVVVAPNGTVTQVHVGAVAPDQLERWIAQARR
jgi:cytochrome c biogenesis protein CcmG, thiol:disulfide interchange protein DsbE